MARDSRQTRTSVEDRASARRGFSSRRKSRRRDAEPVARARVAGIGGHSVSNEADRLRAEGLAPTAWSNGPGDRYAAHEHGYDKVIVVESGSIRFGLVDRAETVDLAEGDRLELPAGTSHDALVGSRGVTCLEAHLPEGSIAAVARRGAGEW
jgi:mannose-6-phosphate isomerase-like protein (cupin superfamily)